jgi:hypothetical protein
MDTGKAPESAASSSRVNENTLVKGVLEAIADKTQTCC